MMERNMTVRDIASTNPHAGDHLAWPDCTQCQNPMRLRSISYTARQQTVTFECLACPNRQVARCSVD